MTEKPERKRSRTGPVLWIALAVVAGGGVVLWTTYAPKLKAMIAELEEVDAVVKQAFAEEVDAKPGGVNAKLENEKWLLFLDWTPERELDVAAMNALSDRVWGRLKARLPAGRYASVVIGVKPSDGKIQLGTSTAIRFVAHRVYGEPLASGLVSPP